MNIERTVVLELSTIYSDTYTIAQKDGFLYITSDKFSNYKIPHAFTTRLGGVSKDEYYSLNLAYSPDREDTIENCRKNYEIFLTYFGYEESNAVLTRQLHTDNIVIVEQMHRGTGFTKPLFECGVDGLITKIKNAPIIIRMADCLPILMCDTYKKIVCAVHSGWKGTFMGIGPKAVDIMKSEFGCNPDNIIVSFGPSIASCCYQVGQDFKESFINKYGNELDIFFKLRSNGIYADMRGINAEILIRAGIKAENISIYQPCTCCNPDFFYSYRRQKDKRGTLAAFISADF